MPKANVLDRVAAEVDNGRTGPAVRRLSSLVHAHPTDLDLRRRLAGLHLRTGNLAEAGRWGYLDPANDPAALAAFERRYRWPRQRLRALRWPGTPEQAPTGYARSRLADLLALAAHEPPGRDRRRPDDRGDPVARSGRGAPTGKAGHGDPTAASGPGAAGRTGRQGEAGGADEYDEPAPRRHTPRARAAWAAAFLLACLALLALVVLGAVTVVGWLR